MPELPEVEAARRFVEKHCEGLQIVDATVADDNSDLRPTPPRSPGTSV
jgi:formamidopyrimidine-DNA glycosylase